MTVFTSLLSLVCTGVFGYLSWMWATVLGALAGVGLWLFEGPLLLFALVAAVGWVSGAWQEGRTLARNMASGA